MAYSLPDVLEALRNADAAGNVEDARKLARIAYQMQQTSRAPAMPTMPAMPAQPKPALWLVCVPVLKGLKAT